jgi:hypothetical protein
VYIDIGEGPISNFALHLGSATRFTVEDIPGNATFPWLQGRIKNEQEHQYRESQLLRKPNADLRDVLLDMMSLSWLLNHSRGHGTKLNEYTFNQSLILIGYRLIRVSPLGGARPVSRLENTLHLGLAAFMATFLLGLGRRCPDFHLLSELARSAAQQCFNDEESQEVLLWTLLIGSVSIFRHLDHLWLIPRVSETSQALGLLTWGDVSQTLSKFPWVNSLHDTPGQLLWQRAKSKYSTPAELQNDLSRPPINSLWHTDKHQDPSLLCQKITPGLSTDTTRGDFFDTRTFLHCQGPKRVITMLNRLRPL